MEKFIAFLSTIIITLVALYFGLTPELRSFDPPGKTGWVPEGCRTVPDDDQLLGAPSTFFRSIHGDILNSDEVSIAVAPMLELDWNVEPNMIVTEGPSLDSQGNAYFSPLFSNEQVVLVKLNSDTGAREWAISGNPTGAGNPLVLDDPDNSSRQIIYLGLYDRALAVRPDKSILWDVETGFVPVTDNSSSRDVHCYGVNYHPQSDSIIGIAGDGHLYALNREKGESLLAEPYLIPGKPSPKMGSMLELITGSVADKYGKAVNELVGGLSEEASPGNIVGAILGYDVQVANYFSIDPNSGYIWTAATAPDDEDGKTDGVSDHGALYCLELKVKPDLSYEINERFHVSFNGGSASTPALSADGNRIYVSDNTGIILAIDTENGDILWQLDLGSEVLESLRVASDNGEIYAATRQGIFKLLDKGTKGEIVWKAELDAYSGIFDDMSVLGPAIGANSLAFMLGSGIYMADMAFPFKLSVGILDRKTGKLRYAAPAVEESVGSTVAGSDGSIYFGHSPIRRLILYSLFGPDFLDKPVGGVSKYSPVRYDLLIRDAVCAASSRAKNAFSHTVVCSRSAETDMLQILNLINQCEAVSAKALSRGDLSSDEWETLSAYLDIAEVNLTLEGLGIAADELQNACAFFDS